MVDEYLIHAKLIKKSVCFLILYISKYRKVYKRITCILHIHILWGVEKVPKCAKLFKNKQIK